MSLVNAAKGPGETGKMKGLLSPGGAPALGHLWMLLPDVSHNSTIDPVHEALQRGGHV